MKRLISRAMNVLKQAAALRARRGPYRYLVRNWHGISDIDIASAVLQADFWTDQLQPVEVPVNPGGPLLVIAPHADDEAIGAGGLLLLAARAGTQIHVVFATDSRPRNSQPAQAANDESVVSLRHTEAQTVCSDLNATMHELGIDNATLRVDASHLSHLGRILGEVSPAAILTPSVLDRPARHRFCNHVLWLAMRRMQLAASTEVWGYQVHSPLFANAFVDITPVAEEKRQLIRRHASQMAVNAYDHTSLGVAAWNARLLGHSPANRYVEVFHTLPVNEFLDRLPRWYMADPQKTYRSDLPQMELLLRLHQQET